MINPKHTVQALRQAANLWRFKNNLPEVNYPALRATFPKDCFLCENGRIAERLDYVLDDKGCVKPMCGVCGRETTTVTKPKAFMDSDVIIEEVTKEWSERNHLSEYYHEVRRKEEMQKARIRRHQSGPTTSESLTKPMEDKKEPFLIRRDGSEAPVVPRYGTADKADQEIQVPPRHAESAVAAAARIAASRPSAEPMSEAEFREASTQKPRGRPKGFSPKKKAAEAKAAQVLSSPSDEPPSAPPP